MKTNTDTLTIDRYDQLHDMRAEDVLQESFIDENDVQGLIEIKRQRSESNRILSNMFYFLGLSISLLVCIIAINWKTYERPDLLDLGNLEAEFDDLMEVPISEQPPPPPPQEKIPQQITEVSDEEIVEDIEFELDVEMTEESVVEDHNIDFTDENIEEEVEEIFVIVEQYPEPEGGMEGFYKYVGENIKYPAQARRMNVQGMVYIQFVVERDGAITDAKVVKGVGAGCDEEAIRVLMSAPKWKPGKQRGRTVRVKLTIPIRFVLQG